MERGACCTFSVDPPLPAGLALDATTGAITGSPTEAADSATYTITATNPSGSTSVELPFSCTEVKQAEATQDFATSLEGVTDFAALEELAPPDKGGSLLDWMIWMVHRAHLNDPTLKEFSFSQLTM